MLWNPYGIVKEMDLTKDCRISHNFIYDCVCNWTWCCIYPNAQSRIFRKGFTNSKRQDGVRFMSVNNNVSCVHTGIIRTIGIAKRVNVKLQCLCCFKSRSTHCRINTAITLCARRISPRRRHIDRVRGRGECGSGYSKKGWRTSRSC